MDGLQHVAPWIICYGILSFAALASLAVDHHEPGVARMVTYAYPGAMVANAVHIYLLSTSGPVKGGEA